MSENRQLSHSGSAWQPWQAYVMAVICLLIGVVVGYLVRGSAPVSSATAPQPVAAPAAPAGDTQQMPSLDDMKRMADKQAEPLLEKLKTDPRNPDLLNQVGNIYRMTHQFQLAASYYQKSLDANPANVGPRTDLASCLYYQGDVDGAIAQLEKSLTYDPKHAGTLLNLGLIRWKGKGDTAGAIAAWNQLLKSNPGFKDRDVVEKLIAEVTAHGNRKAAQAN
ncbi:MAG TPA: tetratricopeptide repeat protein [Candidatus Sulfotelmatobacter sp.]|nr:tetratricopeptide repeat protein [Candidatus Sulfotelmatobacter sp.]